MKEHQEIIRKVLSDPVSSFKPTRSGIFAISRFGHYGEYDLSKGFPLVTTRKINTKAITTELLWFLRGDTNVSYLHEHNVHIWDPWTNSSGSLGEVYGFQWRRWKTSEGGVIDQIEKLISNIKLDPYSKRHIVSAWNVADLDKMALPPCHVLFQFNVNGNQTIDCELYQRAADVALGLPFNIASYSLLTSLIARETGLKEGRFIHSIGDLHIYCGQGARANFYSQNLEKIKSKIKKAQGQQDYLLIKRWIEENAPPEEYNSEKGRATFYDHIPGLLEQLSREPFSHPKLEINCKPLQNLEPKDIMFKDYKYHNQIKFDIAV